MLLIILSSDISLDSCVFLHWIQNISRWIDSKIYDAWKLSKIIIDKRATTVGWTHTTILCRSIKTYSRVFIYLTICFYTNTGTHKYRISHRDVIVKRLCYTVIYFTNLFIEIQIKILYIICEIKIIQSTSFMIHKI